jgi:serine/threonine protein kinase
MTSEGRVATSRQTIGKYVIQEELGKGGFGTVYRAWDPTVNRAVAIKVLKVQDDNELLTRFRNEAAATGKLHHRNIVTIHDFGEHNGTPYMVMQLLDGHTLQDVIAGRKPATLVQKMDFMAQVAEGLHHAHQHGIVHRDVKPSNIMIMPDDSVQIMDFGIARLASDATSRLTQQGSVIGTVLYMAPEQLQGSNTDYRADIWAYGVIYYELLTGKSPFAAPDLRTVFYRIVNDDPPPMRSLNPDIPEDLEHVISRALAKDPAVRYNTLKELQLDVQPIFLEVKRERAAELAAQAEREQSYEDAQAILHQSLELDPGNRKARDLLGVVRQTAQRKLVRPKFDSLIQRAQQELASRNFEQAIECFEMAVRLNEDPAVHIQIEETRGLLERSRRAERLIAEARRELNAKNALAAIRVLRDVLDFDPGNSEAVRLLESVEGEKDVQETRRRFDDVIARVRGLLLLQQFDEAIGILSELARDFPGQSEVAELLSFAERARAEQRRQQRRARESQTVSECLRQGKLDEAIDRLEALLRDFPDDVDFRQLLSYARQDMRRAELIERTKEQAERMLASENYESSLALIHRCLDEFPGEPALVALKERARRAKEECDRQAAQPDRELGNHPPDAIENPYVLSRCDNVGAPASLPNDPIPAAPTPRGKAADDPPDAADEARFTEAIRLCRDALTRYPGEPAFEHLLERIEILRASASRGIVEPGARVPVSHPARLTDSDSGTQSDTGDLQETMHIARQVLKIYPGGGILLEVLEQAASVRPATDAGDLLRLQEKCNCLREAKRFTEALAMMDEAISRQPGSDALRALRAQYQQQMYADLADEAERLLAAGKASEARALLDRSAEGRAIEPRLAVLSERAVEKRPETLARLEDETPARGDVFDYHSILRHLKQLLPWR